LITQSAPARVARLISAIALVCALFTATGSVSRAAGEPFEINVLLPLTGPGAFIGKSEQTALSIIESKTNKAGGINGRPIKFVIQDDTSTPQVAVQLVNDLIGKKVQAIMGPSLTAECGAVAALVKDGPVLYCLSGGYHPPKFSYSFAYGPESADSIDTNIRYFRTHGFKRIAMIVTTDATGQDGERGFDAAIAQPENKDIIVVAREHFANSDQTVAAQMSRIKAAGAQALFTWGTGTPIGTVYRAIQDLGLEIPVSISAPNVVNAQMKQYANILPKNLVSAGMAFMVPNSLPRGALRSAVNDFSASLRDVLGEQPDVGYAIAWDPALILLNAYRKLGFNATAQQIRDYILSLSSWAGANGTYDFRTGTNRGMGPGSAIMVQWDAQKGTWFGVSKFGGGS
jgi:branched-chain amino acid transport system substrate-binding protein